LWVYRPIFRRGGPTIGGVYREGFIRGGKRYRGTDREEVYAVIPIFERVWGFKKFGEKLLFVEKFWGV